MELYVLNENFEVLGLIDTYECLVWERNYYTSGTFSMQIIPDFKQFELLKKGNILLKKDDTKEAMYIDHRELEEDENGIETLLVSGYDLKNWLSRRITLYKENEKANAETVMRNYVSRHCIDTVENNRKIPGLIQGMNNNLGKIIDYSSHYKQLIEEIEAIAKVSELGYRIDLDLFNKKYIFEVNEGLDRTVNQEINSKAIFSTEFENIVNQKYIDSDNNYKNTVLVAGAGEDIDRKTLLLGNSNSGLDRYELFVDARDISDTDDNEIAITTEDYNRLLESRGIEKLSEYSRVKTFDCTLENTNSLIYRVDFDLGDKVSIVNKKWGLILHERITSITETYDTEGLKVEFKIGNNAPNLIDKIKQKLR